MTYGENHRVLRAQQLPEKGDQVDSAGATGKDSPVRRATEEVSMSERAVFPAGTANGSHVRRLAERGFRFGGRPVRLNKEHLSPCA